MITSGCGGLSGALGAATAGCASGFGSGLLQAEAAAASEVIVSETETIVALKNKAQSESGERVIVHTN